MDPTEPIGFGLVPFSYRSCTKQGRFCRIQVALNSRPLNSPQPKVLNVPTLTDSLVEVCLQPARSLAAQPVAPCRLRSEGGVIYLFVAGFSKALSRLLHLKYMLAIFLEYVLILGTLDRLGIGVMTSR